MVPRRVCTISRCEAFDPEATMTQIENIIVIVPNCQNQTRQTKSHLEGTGSVHFLFALSKFRCT
jgi:hypothetical protein